MAHTTPASGTPHTPATRPLPAITAQRPPDLFDRRTHTAGRIAVPVALGLVFGYWAASTRRHGGPITGWNLLFGFVTALVFAALCIALFTVAPHLERGRHALLWAAFAGCALGFLYSQSGHSVFSSSGLGLVIAGAVFLFTFYRYYTHEKLERPEKPAG